ncbi:MAG: secreted PhoX family phosphatase [Natronomonas sp.]|jgi:secreted PhoX family phosphatase
MSKTQSPTADGEQISGPSIERAGLLPRPGHDTRQAVSEDEQRAREQSMLVVPYVDMDGEATGMYEVFTESPDQDGGDLGRYDVDLAGGDGGRCLCPHHQYREARCKHIRRVALAINESDVPAPEQDATRYMGAGLTARVRAFEAEHAERVAAGGLTERAKDAARLAGAARRARDEWKSIRPDDGDGEPAPFALTDAAGTLADLLAGEPCAECGKTFDSEAARNGHMAVHSPSDPACPTCGETFGTEPARNGHMAVHSRNGGDGR